MGNKRVNLCTRDANKFSRLLNILTEEQSDNIFITRWGIAKIRWFMSSYRISFIEIWTFRVCSKAHGGWCRVLYLLPIISNPAKKLPWHNINFNFSKKDLVWPAIWRCAFFCWKWACGWPPRYSSRVGSINSPVYMLHDNIHGGVLFYQQSCMFRQNPSSIAEYNILPFCTSQNLDDGVLQSKEELISHVVTKRSRKSSCLKVPILT